MTSTALGLTLLYFSIVATTFLSSSSKFHFLGPIAVASCLLLFDMPDFDIYKEHYLIASQAGISFSIFPYNFEPGYNLIVSFFSKVIPFQVFYVLIISSAIQAYIRVYHELAGRKSFVYISFFLSACLYFIAFSLRTTFASIFLAYAILFLKDGKNLIATLIIIAGAFFQVSILPMFILPSLNLFSKFVSRMYIFWFFALIMLAALVHNIVQLDNFYGYNELFDLKLNTYKDVNIVSNSAYFGLWILVYMGALASFKLFDKFDRVLIFSTAFSLTLFYPYGFLQGRLMWLMSFIFAYFFIKVGFDRLILRQPFGVIFAAFLPLLAFLRY